MFLIFTSSCGRSADKSVPAVVPDNSILKGTITESFKTAQWSNFENKKTKAEFIQKEISGFPSADYTLSDVFEKDNDIIAALQKSEGDTEYYKISGDAPGFSKAYDSEVIDPVVAQDINEDEELWGFQKYNEYELVIKNLCTDIFKDGVKINSIEGVAAIGDLDGNGTYELIQRNIEGKAITVYQIINDNLIKVWELASESEIFDGDIQIGDLNGDGVSEFYVGDTKGNMKKFILSKNGFEEDKSFPILYNGKSGTYYIVDYNKDSKMDVVLLNQDKNPVVNLQK